MNYLRLCIAISLAAVFFVVPGANAAAQTACTDCHETIAALLPAKHPTQKGTGIAECLKCHKQQSPAKKNPFVNGLHVAHAEQGTEGCNICHQVDGEQRLLMAQTQQQVGNAVVDDLPLLSEIVASYADSAFTEKWHRKADVSCGSCHADNPPALEAEVDNATCLGCHGPLDSLVKKTTPAEHADRNPHQSHLGEIACTVCHHMHYASEVYCIGCHPKFKMTIPGAE